VTVSVGVGVLNPETMRTPDDLLRVTDDRLYRAKRSGKNQVVSNDLQGET
jgi:PleD family two-component response regulator